MSQDLPPKDQVPCAEIDTPRTGSSNTSHKVNHGNEGVRFLPPPERTATVEESPNTGPCLPSRTPRPNILQRITAMMGGRPKSKTPSTSRRSSPVRSTGRTPSILENRSEARETTPLLPSSIQIPRLLPEIDSTEGYYSFPPYQGTNSSHTGILSALLSTSRQTTPKGTASTTPDEQKSSAVKRWGAQVLGRLSPSTTPSPKAAPAELRRCALSDVVIRPPTRGSKFTPRPGENRWVSEGWVVAPSKPSVQLHGGAYNAGRTSHVKEVKQTTTILPSSSTENHESPTPSSSQVARVASAPPAPLALLPSQDSFPRSIESLRQYQLGTSIARPTRPTDWSRTTTNSFIRRRGGVPLFIRHDQDPMLTIESETEPEPSATETEYFAGSSSSSSGRVSEERWFTEGKAWGSPVHGYGQGNPPLSSKGASTQKRDRRHMSPGEKSDQSWHNTNVKHQATSKHQSPTRIGGEGWKRHGSVPPSARYSPRAPNALQLRGGAGSSSSSFSDEASDSQGSSPAKKGKNPLKNPGRPPKREHKPERRVDPQRRVPQHLWFFAGGKPGQAPTVDTYRKYYGKPNGHRGDPGTLGKLFGVGNWGLEYTREREASAASSSATGSDAASGKGSGGGTGSNSGKKGDRGIFKNMIDKLRKRQNRSDPSSTSSETSAGSAHSSQDTSHLGNF